MPATRKKIPYAIWIVMGAGILLSFIPFISNRSLWLDEAMLSLNIINRNYGDLLKPLDYLQVAPIGFLVIEKTNTLLLPNTEFGLRLFPLLCFWASIFLFYKITELLLVDSRKILLALILFCLNASLIYYASEVKQYMVDLFVCLLLYFFLLKSYQKEVHRLIVLALSGAACIPLSNVSVIVLCTIGLFLIWKKRQQKTPRYFLLAIPFLSWTIIFTAYYFRFIYHHPSQAGMLAYWANCFLPNNPFTLSFWDFCFYKSKMVFTTLLAFGKTGIIPFLFFLMALFVLIQKKNRKLLFLLFFPSLLHVLLSAVKRYPFDHRLILYQSGFYIIAVSIGAVESSDWLAYKTNLSRLKWIPLILPLLLCLQTFSDYPAQTEEIKKSIDFISQNIKPEQHVYVYYGAIPAFTYYQKIGKIKFRNTVILGHGYRGENPKYVNEIRSIPADSWILFSHMHDDEKSYITHALDSVYSKELSYAAIGSETFLYKKN